MSRIFKAINQSPQAKVFWAIKTLSNLILNDLLKTSIVFDALYRQSAYALDIILIYKRIINAFINNHT